VVALQALALFSRRIFGGGLNVKVHIGSEDQALNFNVNQDNRVVLQHTDLTRPEADITLTAKGSGCVLVQVYLD